MEERLQKLLAHAGLASRREIETWIDAGRVAVNGRRAKLGDKANPFTDQVTVDGQPSAHIEHTVAVLAEGPWRLTGPPETDEEWEFVGGRNAADAD